MTETIIDQAIAWHFAQENSEFDWDGFSSWLEADPAHRRAFDEVALLNAKISENRLALTAMLPPVEVQAAGHGLGSPGRPTSRVGGAVAALLALGVAGRFLWRALLSPEARRCSHRRDKPDRRA